MKRDPLVLIDDIVENANLALDLAVSMPLEHFVDDRVARAAVERWVFIVGEAANRLDGLSRAMFPGVPWRDIVGMRHRLAHGYDTLVPSLVHAIACNDLPPLIEKLRMRPFLIKTCGLKDEAALDVAIGSGATMFALNLFPKSPRFVEMQQAAMLASKARGKISVCCLVVDPGDELIGRIKDGCKPDFLQLHGSEPPERVRNVKQQFGVSIIKAIGISSSADLDMIPQYATVADAILLDAKPPRDAAYPGGHGKPFDWAILKALDPKQPFILSGGLTPENVADAIATIRGYGLNLIGVDVSSGVESAPGVKDAAKIEAFVKAARALVYPGSP